MSEHNALGTQSVMFRHHQGRRVSFPSLDADVSFQNEGGVRTDIHFERTHLHLSLGNQTTWLWFGQDCGGSEID